MSRAETGLPCDDVVRFGPEKLYLRRNARRIRKQETSARRMKNAPCLASIVAVALLRLHRLHLDGRPQRSADDGERRTFAWTKPGLNLRIGSADEPDALNPLFGTAMRRIKSTRFCSLPLFRYDPRGELDARTRNRGALYAKRRHFARFENDRLALAQRRAYWSDGVPLGPKRSALHVACGDEQGATTYEVVRAVGTTSRRSTCRTIRNRRHQTHQSVRMPTCSESSVVAAAARTRRLPEHLLGKLPVSIRPISTRTRFRADRICSQRGITDRHSSSRRTPRIGAARRSSHTSRFASCRTRIPSSRNCKRTKSISMRASARRNSHACRKSPACASSVIRPRIGDALAMNCSRPGLSDVRVRLAIAEAIDWDHLNATVYHGANVRSHERYSGRLVGRAEDPVLSARPFGSAARTRRGGLSHGTGRRSHGRKSTCSSFTISATNKPGNSEAEVQMQQELKPLGIALTIKNFPASTLFAQNGPLYGGTYDLEWSIDTNGPDPDNQGIWSEDFIPPKGASTSFLRDPYHQRNVGCSDPHVRSSGAQSALSARRDAHPRTRPRRLLLLADGGCRV